MPLRKKALQTAMEFFGQRPDLAIGAAVRIVRGGLEVSLFRCGRDLRIHISSVGSFLLSGHRPLRRPDLMITKNVVTRSLLDEIEAVIPYDETIPLLDRMGEGDVNLRDPFDGFGVMRFIPGQHEGDCRLLIGRDSVVGGLYAFQDALDLPEDLFRDQPLAGGSRLSDLLAGYVRERRRAGVPV